jgi:TonB family protein
MKTATLLFSLTIWLWVSGCATQPVARAEYQDRADEKMKTPPRSETETAEQKADREAKEKALGRSIHTLSVGDDFTPSRLVRMVQPEYPAAARKSGIVGSAKVAVVIDESGAVGEATIVESSDPVFDLPALNAVKQWRFTPAKKNGKPVRVAYTIPVDFKLE